MKFVIVTGMSGAGKGTAVKMMEDMGYYCVDNLPIPLMEKFIGLAVASQDELSKVAVSIDIRSGDALDELQSVLNRIREQGLPLEILFLEAEDSVLIKRYKETRRNHPLSGVERLDKGIGLERKKLEFIKRQADYIIDTSRLLSRELKVELEKIFIEEQEYKSMYITVLSFGFKYGIPTDSDLVFDVRFLPNPYYVEDLRAKTGNDKEIQDFVLQYEEAYVFLDKLENMIEFLIPNYISEGKSQLVISIGCTGGKHRSVTLANALYQRLKERPGYGIKIEHRDIGKDALRGK
ncbi:MAG: RNase adapter RapZ [Lachnospiraceae bacterium]|nr:RNase adapter RapZ [Lachnospiraceae bacterium]